MGTCPCGTEAPAVAGDRDVGALPWDDEPDSPMERCHTCFDDAPVTFDFTGLTDANEIAGLADSLAQTHGLAQSFKSCLGESCIGQSCRADDPRAADLGLAAVVTRQRAVLIQQAAGSAAGAPSGAPNAECDGLLAGCAYPADADVDALVHCATALSVRRGSPGRGCLKSPPCAVLSPSTMPPDFRTPADPPNSEYRSVTFSGAVPPSRASTRASAARPPPQRRRSSAAPNRRLPEELAALPPGAQPRTHLCKDWHALDAAGEAHLRGGDAVFCFGCASGASLSAYERQQLAVLLGAPGGPPPPIDARNDGDLADNIFMTSKYAYVIPDLPLADFTAEWQSSFEYVDACHQGAMTARRTEPGKNLFHVGKTVIPFVFSIDMLYEVHEVPKEDLFRFGAVTDGVAVDRAFTFTEPTSKAGMMQRTILLYHDLGGRGVVIWNLTTMAFSALPSMVVSTIDSLGSMAAKEVSGSAVSTRKYWASGGWH